jgi:prepilin-type N-terminal cleavage/methylation domain-containing protein
MTDTRSPGIPRRAFTLVEMLVVMLILVIIATIAAAVVPSMLRNGKAGQGASMIQGMLLAAKQRAIRDRVNSGVRFIVTQDNLNAPAGSNCFRLISTELCYVLQPDDLVITNDSMGVNGTPPGPYTVTSSTQDFSGGMGATGYQSEQFPVQAGDFLECSGAGLVTAIQGIGTNGVLGATVQNQLTTLSNPSNGQPVTDYRIMRMPRRVPGEDSVKLPADVTVLVADIPLNFPQPSGGSQPVSSFSNYTFYSLNIPARVVPFQGSSNPPATYYYEIVFGPSGAVLGQGTSSGDKICIWVRDSSRDKVTDGEPVFVVVNARTGAISTQPVDVTGSGYTYSSTNPPYGSGLTTQPKSSTQSGYYTFTTDVRASGM